jgi:transcriptional regulator with XRE-family HTH domain
MEKSFGERLRELRGQFSQEIFARKIGTKQTTLSSWERNVSQPDLEWLGIISSRLHVSVDWLLGLTKTQVNTSDIDAETKEYIKVLEAKLQETDAKLSEKDGIIQGLKMALKSLGISSK